MRSSWHRWLRASVTLSLCCLCRLRLSASLALKLLLLLLAACSVFVVFSSLTERLYSKSTLDDARWNPSLTIFPRTQSESVEYNDGMRRHSFNVFVSDRLSLSRPLPDTRHPGCRTKSFYADSTSFDNLTTSVIVCFYNEAKSALRRTVQTVVDRTPPHLLYEILLLDDDSNNGMSASDVAFISSKIRYVHAPMKMGLVKARNFAARMAKGEALVFLDSHVEVNIGWLEPLLHHLSGARARVALPMIDVIDDRTLTYSATPPVVGSFTWGLRFAWEPLPPQASLETPFPSPAMSGGLLAMRTSDFFAFGAYDNEMETWGGENLEMSFRLWLCGGTVHACPCSRVGHVFRSRRPYGEFTGRNSWLFNTARLARVWLGPFKEVFYSEEPRALELDVGDLTERLRLKSRLKCRDFKWYVAEVAPARTRRALPAKYRHLLV